MEKDMQGITPYNTSDSKKEQVAQMFDNIAFRYDLLNSILSLGIHKGWRKKCVRSLRDHKPQMILDVATGTGDFAIECAVLQPKKIIGVDISEGMMKFGKEKILKKGLNNLITLEYGDAETLAFPDNTFDAIVVGFGVRNFEDLEKGLINLRRVLKPNGRIVILEFSNPRNGFIRWLYNFYFNKVTPFIGRLFSKDVRAYTYLPESVKAFPDNERFTAILERLSYREVSYKSLCFGISAIYYGTK